MFGILIYKQLQAETHKLERNKCSKCLWGHVTHVRIWTCYRNILVIALSCYFLFLFLWIWFTELASSEQDAKQFVMLATWAYTSFFGNVVNMSGSRVQAVFCAFFAMDRFTLFLVCRLLLTFNFVTYWISLSEFLKGQKRLNNNVLLCWLLTYDMINS